MLQKAIDISFDLLFDSFDLGSKIHQKLNSVSSGWLLIDNKGETRSQLVVKKSEKYDNLAYGFCAWKESGDQGWVYLAPTTVKFDSENNVASEFTIFVSPLYSTGYKPTYSNSVPSSLTIGIGKKKKSFCVSITQKDAGYIYMNAVCGEDSIGDPYAFSPACRPGQWDGLNGLNPMLWGTYDHGSDYRESEIRYSWYPNFNTELACIGFVSSDKLALIPFVNPITGNVCPDLYMPLCGPTSTMIFDVTVGNRTFFTGASQAATNPSSGISIENYDPFYKIFMEV